MLRYNGGDIRDHRDAFINLVKEMGCYEYYELLDTSYILPDRKKVQILILNVDQSVSWYHAFATIEGEYYNETKQRGMDYYM